MMDPFKSIPLAFTVLDNSGNSVEVQTQAQNMAHTNIFTNHKRA